MAKRMKQDKEREERIAMEIIVDAYGPEEQAMGWYYYLEEKLHFPFAAICVAKRAISPLQVKDEVEVIGMAPEEECDREIFITISWKKKVYPFLCLSSNPLMKRQRTPRKRLRIGIIGYRWAISLADISMTWITMAEYSVFKMRYQWYFCLIMN